MTPERGSAPVVQTEAQEKRLPEAWSGNPTLRKTRSQDHRYGLRHIGAILAETLEPVLRLS